MTTNTSPTPEQSAPGLLPCPFCGGANLDLSDGYDEDANWVVVCRSCRSSGTFSVLKTVAVKCWNARVGADVATGEAPIDMLLFCPACWEQYVDAPEDETTFRHRMEAWGLVAEPQDHHPSRWTNPPHRSHLCHKCGAVWRPADVPTNGVAKISTTGSRDIWIPCPAVAQPTESGPAWTCAICGQFCANTEEMKWHECGMPYSVLKRETGYEPRMWVRSGGGSHFWTPLLATGYWAEPESFSTGVVKGVYPLSSQEQAQQAVKRALSLNNEERILSIANPGNNSNTK